jgi:hypothetical protein
MGNFIHQITGFCCNSTQCLPLIVEVENLTQLQQVLPLDGVERVLCDNYLRQVDGFLHGSKF